MNAQGIHHTVTEGNSTMKRTALALLLATGLTASPVMAQQQHDHANQAAAQQQDHSGHMMHDSEAMTAHREKMAEMRALMQQARGERSCRTPKADGRAPRKDAGAHGGHDAGGQRRYDGGLSPAHDDDARYDGADGCPAGYGAARLGTGGPDRC